MNLGTWYNPSTWVQDFIGGQTPEERSATWAQLEATYQRQIAEGKYTPEEQAFIEQQLQDIQNAPASTDIFWQQLPVEIKSQAGSMWNVTAGGMSTVVKLLLAFGVVYGLILFTPTLWQAQRRRKSV